MGCLYFTDSTIVVTARALMDMNSYDPTRTTLDSKTIIDHIITNRTDFVRNCDVVHFGISGHDAVFYRKTCGNSNSNYPPKLSPPEIISILIGLHFSMT